LQITSIFAAAIMVAPSVAARAPYHFSMVDDAR
jgi:hypothetical protein